MATTAQQSLAIRRRMTWSWFVLAYSLFTVITTSATICFVTAVLTFSDSDAYDQLNADDHLIRYCRTHQLRVDCDQLDDRLRQEYAVARASEDIPTWMVAAFYVMAFQVLGAAVYGLYASSGRLRDLRLELRALEDYDKLDGEDAHMLSERARSMDAPDDERDAVRTKGGPDGGGQTDRGNDAPGRAVG